MYNDYYLEHHGIKNQKWGLRRFQNQDGSLTDAGKKRYNSSNSEKQVKSLSTEELRKKTERLNAENNYMRAVDTNKELKNTKSKNGKNIVSKMATFTVASIVAPAVAEVGKQALKKYLKNTVTAMAAV